MAWIEKVLRLLTAGLFSAAILLNFANIIGRYIFSAPIYWAEEVTILLVIWAVFLTGFELAFRGDQLKMGVLDSLLPPQHGYLVQAILAIFGAIIAAYMVYESVAVVEMLARFAQVTVVAEIPKWLLFSSIAAGFSLITLASLIRIVTMVRAYRDVARNNGGRSLT